MSPAKAAVPARSAHPDCPVLSEPCHAQLRACVKESRAFSVDVLRWLEGRGPEDKAAWVQSTVGAGRALFQPWAMEILFVLALVQRARFNELQGLLNGISSRTLSDKLQLLREAGFVERVVHDEQPVRIEYLLTRQGLKAAALATPLFAQLNNPGL